MKRIFFLLMFLFTGAWPLKADGVSSDDQDFIKELYDTKDPFENDIPKPPPVVVKPVYNEEPKPVIPQTPRIVPKPVPVEITLPAMYLQGVIVGEGIYQAIIDDEVVPVGDFVKGAKLESVTKEGVEMLFKGKKFFLKVN